MVSSSDPSPETSPLPEDAPADETSPPPEAQQKGCSLWASALGGLLIGLVLVCLGGPIVIGLVTSAERNQRRAAAEQQTALAGQDEETEEIGYSRDFARDFNAITEVSETFLERLQAGDYNTAYQFLSQSAQNNLGTPEALGAQFGVAGGGVQGWYFYERDVSYAEGTGTAVMEGRIVLGNTERPLQMTLTRNSEQVWRIASFSFDEP